MTQTDPNAVGPGENPNDQFPGSYDPNKPYGVPSDYLTKLPKGDPAQRGEIKSPGGQWQTMTSIGTIPSDHLYVPGDEWAPANDPDNIVQVQVQMVQAGLIDPKMIRPGVWDVNCADAYKKVLAYANSVGSEAQGALRILSSNPAIGQNQTQEPVHYVTNPETARASYRSAAEQLTGRGTSDAQADKFATSYQNQERAAYTDATKGGEAIAQPQLGDAAEAAIRKNDPQSVIAYGAASRMMEFQHLLDSATGL